MIRDLPESHALLYLCDLPAQQTCKEHCQTYRDSGESALWLHLCAVSPETRQWLETQTDLDPLLIDALLADDTRPRFLGRKDGILLNLRTTGTHGPGPGGTEDSEADEEMISIRLWATNSHILTFRRRDNPALLRLQSAIARGEGPRNSGQFIARLLEEITNDIGQLMTTLEDRITESEIHLADGNYQACHDIAPIRRTVTHLSHYLGPQSVAIHRFLAAQPAWVNEMEHASLVESDDDHTRHVEDLASVRDRAVILTEELRTLQANRLNSITYLFSVAATIFLPLSFLTGLLGVNLGGIPGTGSSQAFWIFVGACIILIAAQVILFKKLKWF